MTKWLHACMPATWVPGTLLLTIRPHRSAQCWDGRRGTHGFKILSAPVLYVAAAKRPVPMAKARRTGTTTIPSFPSHCSTKWITSARVSWAEVDPCSCRLRMLCSALIEKENTDAGRPRACIQKACEDCSTGAGILSQAQCAQVHAPAARCARLHQ